MPNLISFPIEPNLDLSIQIPARQLATNNKKSRGKPAKKLEETINCFILR